jgi:hypothetical protein
MKRVEEWLLELSPRECKVLRSILGMTSQAMYDELGLSEDDVKYLDWLYKTLIEMEG